LTFKFDKICVDSFINGSNASTDNELFNGNENLCLALDIVFLL
jgi:hypothetical protein